MAEDKKRQSDVLFITDPTLTQTFKTFEAASAHRDSLVKDSAATPKAPERRVRVRPRQDGTFDVVVKLAQRPKAPHKPLSKDEAEIARHALSGD